MANLPGSKPASFSSFSFPRVRILSTFLDDCSTSRRAADVGFCFVRPGKFSAPVCGPIYSPVSLVRVLGMSLQDKVYVVTGKMGD